MNYVTTHATILSLIKCARCRRNGCASRRALRSGSAQKQFMRSKLAAAERRHYRVPTSCGIAGVIFFPINAPGMAMGRFQLLNLGVLGYGLELRFGFGLELRFWVVIAIIVSVTLTITLITTLTIITLKAKPQIKH